MGDPNGEGKAIAGDAGERHPERVVSLSASEARRPEPTTLDRRATLTVLLLCLCWGFTQVVIKVGNQGVAPVFASALRSTQATLLLVGWCTLRGIRLFERDGSLPHGLVIGLLFGAEFLFIYLGLFLTTASHGVLFIYTAPFFVAAGAHLLLPEERMTARKLLGLGLAFGGILAIVIESLTLPTRQQLIGDLSILLAAVLWAATTLYIKRFVAGHITFHKTLFYQLAVSAVFLGVASWALEHKRIIALTSPVLASLAFQGIVVAFVSYLAWFWLIQNYPVSQLSAFTFATPIFGVLSGILFLGEPFTGYLLLGVLLVAGGIALVNRP